MIEKILAIHADGGRSFNSQQIFGGLAEEGDLPFGV